MVFGVPVRGELQQRPYSDLLLYLHTDHGWTVPGTYDTPQHGTHQDQINGLLQDCSNSSVSAMELLQLIIEGLLQIMCVLLSYFTAPSDLLLSSYLNLLMV